LNVPNVKKTLINNPKNRLGISPTFHSHFSECESLLIYRTIVAASATSPDGNIGKLLHFTLSGGAFA